MRHTAIKIMLLIVLGIGIVFSLNLNIIFGTRWTSGTLANVEALTSPETENPYYPCVKANGYCTIKGILIQGIAFVKE